MEFDPIFQQIESAITDLIQLLKENPPAAPLPLNRSARLPLAISLQQALQSPILLITDRSDRALAMGEEISLWKPTIARAFFAEPASLFYEFTPWGDQVRRDRLSVLSQLSRLWMPGQSAISPPLFIIAPLRAVMTRTMPRRDFLKATRTLKIGSQQSMEDLTHAWNAMGYERVNTVIEPGQFARRGGILDVWSSPFPYPVRIEFFGDEIESIRPYDPATQRTTREINPLEKLILPPAREFLRPENPPDFLLEGEELSEFHLPLLHPLPATILDYLPQNALIILDEPEALRQASAEIEEKAQELRSSAIREGHLQPDFPAPYLSWSEIEDNLHSRCVLNLGFENEDEALHPAKHICEYFQPQPRFAGRIKPFVEQLQRAFEAGEQIWVVSRQKSRLEEVWKEYESAFSHENRTPLGRITFVQGSISEGWTFHPPQFPPIHVFSDGEIFGIRPPEIRQRKRYAYQDPEAAYADLQPGDYVVHVDHGIGIFIGLVTRTIDDIEREYLCIEYANNSQLFVPVYQADRVTRYIGSDKRPPAISHLGTPEWRNIKAHVKEAVVEVAEDLLHLYAQRSVIVGHAFSPDTQWQKELEASFPYIETEDQVRVLQEVKADMEKERPMDRLICGDVGYGKTEVALRAAFKCVMDGKQVAVLVPTTILAQQHFETFRQRLAPFPIEVEMLSRFRTPQQQQEIIQKLSQGKLDIVIGTHRLLSNDVQFKDLGLLIIDEEQRFGVIHKEKLKKMRTEVDVLTLTATPIPRTLYLALSGVRDISTINTPPEERMPVVTYVGPYSPELIRKAVLRELERGGQVFFVHNRVQTIYAMLSHLEKLIPEARIAVAHGQMPEYELAERMRQFTNSEVDVLLSTSIIESGLDIPNANTLIVDRADTFGLAQLYQLRGRVGRGAQRAYAYFFRHRRKNPTPEGRQRLETIAENTQLGAGFSIAMRDLEIRGTGDILGTRQSGHVSAVGLHLYTRLLAEAVRRMQKKDKTTPEPVVEAVPEIGLSANVDLPLTANIPVAYVPDKAMRLRLYRRLAHLQSLQEIDQLQAEFQDRFGPLPDTTQNLLFQMKIKILAQRAGLTVINVDNGQLVLKFPEGEPPLINGDLPSSARLGKSAIWFAYATTSNWRDELVSLLRQIHSPLINLQLSG